MIGYPTAPPDAPHECFGIVGFHEKPFVRAHLSDVNSPTLNDRIDDLPNRVGHGNDLAAALTLATSLLARKDKSFLRNIWLFSDGMTASSRAEVDQAAEFALAQFVNINVVPVGNQYDDGLLESIVRRTHNGKYVCPISFMQTTDELVNEGYRHPELDQSLIRNGATVVITDLSVNTLRRFENGRIIDVIVDLTTRLLDLNRRRYG